MPDQTYLVQGPLTAPGPNTLGFVVSDVLAMRAEMYRRGYHGPYALKFGSAWTRWMRTEYIVMNGVGQTLRCRLESIDSIESADLDPEIPPGAVLLVQETPKGRRIAMATTGE